MKKLWISLLSLLLVFSIVGCDSNQTPQMTESSMGKMEMQTVTEESQSESSEGSKTVEPVENESSILIVYFSRWGNTDYPDDVDATTSASIIADGEIYGTTEYVARMIQKTVGGDIHLIETVTPYTADFDELRDVNHNEMSNNTLPELKESNLDIAKYDTVFVGYPVWATDVPQAVISFLNQYDLSGKTVIPFCTHDGYGAGSSYRTISDVSKAEKTLDGLAIEAKDVPDSQNVVTKWLNSTGVLKQESNSLQSGQTAIKIAIDDTVLNGVLYDTALAEEIKAYFPLTISMSGYGGREYYGSVDFYPADENLIGGVNTFENGDITYCEAHHNMAIFYAQTDNPNLSVDVIPIGRVTSDLSLFNTLDNREKITFSLAE